MRAHARLRGRDDNPAIEPTPPTVPAPVARAPRGGVRGWPSRAATWFIPEHNPADSVYGLVAIGALLAAESGLHDTYFDTVLSAVIAALLYWLLHAYSTVLGLRLTTQWRLNAATLGRALTFHQPVLRGAAIPVAALLAAWVTGAAQATAVLVALWSAVAGLIVLEVVAGIRARSSSRELLAHAALGLTMGLALLSLKIILH